MRFKKSPQLPGAGRIRAGHHHGSDMPNSLRAISKRPKHFWGSVCKHIYLEQ